MKKTVLIIILTILTIISCNQEKKEDIVFDECSELVSMIEDCMNLHRGAFSYLENCGTLSLDRAKSYQTCDELLEYVGIDR